MNKKDILKCKSKSDVCKLLNISTNGRGMKRVDNLLLEYNISLYYFNNEKNYYKNPKYCKHCHKVLPYNKRNNNFCNNSCSASFNNKKRKLSEETKDKIRNSLLKSEIKLISKKCEYCNNNFDVKNNSISRRRKYCSDKCRKEGMKINLSKTMKERFKKGLHKGWQSRNILSYP